MKIGLLGKMASGKTTTAQLFQQYFPQLQKLSFADPVKQIATQIFNMKGKNRELLQDIGGKMREIDPNVWVNFTIRLAEQYADVIIDDVRYLNEIDALKNAGFTIVYLEVTAEQQRERILTHYWDDATQHFDRLNHESEQADRHAHLADHTIQASSIEQLTKAVRVLIGYETD
jgi:dephospho-CoA kinase